MGLSRQSWVGYEGLVGWRYLLSQRPKPFALLLGLGLTALGAGVLWWLTAHLQSAGAGLSVFGSPDVQTQIILGVGASLALIGLCTTLFGLLNYFLTVFAAFSAFMIAIGVAVVILVLAVMNGFQGDLRAKIIDTHAHVLIEAAQPQDHLADYRDLTRAAAAVAGVEGATPILTTEVMISAPTNLAPVHLTGIDIETIGTTSKLPQFLQRGSLQDLIDLDGMDAYEVALRQRLKLPALDNEPDLGGEPERGGPAEDPAGSAEDLGEMAFPTPGGARPPSPPSLLVGNELRKNLNLYPTLRVNVVSPFGELGPHGPSPRSRPFRVAGWFNSGMLEYDTRIAYAALADVQHFLGLEDVASAVQVRVHDLDAARRVREALQAQLGDRVRVTDWQERNFNLFSALKLEKIAMFLVLTINILLAAFSITGTLLMTIIKRRREIAILSAMGSSTGSIVRIFLSQGAFTGLVGSLLGAAIGLSAAYGLSQLSLPIDNDVYYISAIPVELRGMDVLAIVAVALLVSMLSTLYPARYAAGLRPIEGLKA